MKERGFLDSTLAMYLIGLSLLVWLISFLLGWVYETKEQRTGKRQDHTKEELSMHLSKEQILKYGIGEYEAHCSGLFVKNCSLLQD